MRNLIRASMLVLALSCCAYAGNMPINYTEPPPPPPTSTEADTQGYMPNGDTAEVALNVLGSLLSLF